MPYIANDLLADLDSLRRYYNHGALSKSEKPKYSITKDVFFKYLNTLPSINPESAESGDSDLPSSIFPDPLKNAVLARLALAEKQIPKLGALRLHFGFKSNLLLQQKPRLASSSEQTLQDSFP